MRSIDIDETQVPWTASFGHTLLRAVLGFILIGHGLERFIHLQEFQRDLVALAISDPEIVALCLLGAQGLAGFCLVIGRWARFSAFIGLCEAFAVVSVIAQQNRIVEKLGTIESAVLFGTAAFFFITSGAGQFSADSLLRKRARIKAIRDDEIWQRPPYVSPDESGVYDEQSDEDDYESPVVIDGRRGGRLRYSRG